MLACMTVAYTGVSLHLTMCVCTHVLLSGSLSSLTQDLQARRAGCGKTRLWSCKPRFAHRDPWASTQRGPGPSHSHTCVCAQASGLTGGPSRRPRWRRWSRATAQPGWRQRSCSRRWSACAVPRCGRSALEGAGARPPAEGWGLEEQVRGALCREAQPGAGAGAVRRVRHLPLSGLGGARGCL